MFELNALVRAFLPPGTRANYPSIGGTPRIARDDPYGLRSPESHHRRRTLHPRHIREGARGGQPPYSRTVVRESNEGTQQMFVGELAEQAKSEGIPASVLLRRFLGEVEDLDGADAQSAA